MVPGKSPSRFEIILCYFHDPFVPLTRPSMESICTESTRHRGVTDQFFIDFEIWYQYNTIMYFWFNCRFPDVLSRSEGTNYDELAAHNYISQYGSVPFNFGVWSALMYDGIFFGK